MADTDSKRGGRGITWLALLIVVALTSTSCAQLLRATTPNVGGVANARSWSSDISADGRYVAFVSEASNLTAGDTNGSADVFIRDNSTKTTQLVSGTVGTPADGPSTTAALSANGRFVAFVSGASNLTVGDTNGVDDVFVWDQLTGTTTRTSVGAAGAELSWPSGSQSCVTADTATCAPIERGVSISDDGTQVAFISHDPATAAPAILWRDTTTGLTTAPVVSPQGGGGPARRYFEVAMSGDASTLAYSEESLAGSSGLTTIDRSHASLMTLDRGAASTTAVSVAGQAFGTDGCCEPSLSANGRYVAFTTNAVHVPEDDNVSGCPSSGSTCRLDIDTFVYDRQASVYTRVSVGPTGAEIDAGAIHPSISADGNRIVFSSSAPIVFGVPAAVKQVYLRDRGAATTTVVSVGVHGFANVDARATLAAGGGLVALESAATTLGGAVVAPEVFTGLADQPSVTGPAQLQAGAANAVVTVTGTGLTPLLSAVTTAYDLTINAVTFVSATQFRLNVSTPTGASLGPRQIVLTNVGPYGLTATTVCQCVNVTWAYQTGSRPLDKPDIIVINTDDQRSDSMDEMPLMQARGGWAKFDNSFVEEPQCCPSRASILTGKYAHHTSVTTLRNGHLLDETTTVATQLDNAGYRTFLGGKYLNGYPFAPAAHRPLGWDDWVAFAGRSPNAPPDFPANGHTFYWYQTFENTALVQHGDQPTEYSTDYYFDQGRDFIRQSDPNDPLFLYIAPMSPHTPLVPAKRNVGACNSRSFPQPPNFNSYDTAGEPEWMSGATPYTGSALVKQRRITCEMLQSLDENTVAMIDELQAAGRLDNAYVIFTSDNGYMFGEHRLVAKGNLYDESIRVPLWVRGPGVVPGSENRLTSNIDITPTILDWANVTPTSTVDGQSFADDLEGQDIYPNPTRVLLYGCRTGGSEDDTDCGGYREPMGTAWGVRTDRYKYVEYEDGYVQVFDLQADPWERTNIALAPANASLVASLRNELVAARTDAAGITGRVTNKSTGAPLAGIQVWVRPVGGDWIYSTTTHTNGRYGLLTLPPGSYQVRFDDPSGVYKRQFFNGASTSSTATIIVAGYRTGIDAALKPI